MENLVVVQTIRRLRLSLVSMNLSWKLSVLQDMPLTLTSFQCICPWPLLGGAHSLVQPVHRKLCQIEIALLLLCWPLILIVYGSPTQSVRFICIVQAGAVCTGWHACKCSAIRHYTGVRQSASRNINLTWSPSGDSGSHCIAAKAGAHLPAFSTGLWPDCSLLVGGRSLSHCFQPPMHTDLRPSRASWLPVCCSLLAHGSK